MKNKFFGFTLAEVLITLGIIGVVAALTIPTLMLNSQKQQYVSGLKKAYTQMAQAMALIENDYGSPGDLKGTGLFGSASTQDSLGQAFAKYLKVVKDCGSATNKDCWAAKTLNYYDASNSSDVTYFNTLSAYKFVTADGMSFALYNYAPLDASYQDCAFAFSSGKTNNLKQICATFYVDVNGIKPPNVYGRDTFAFYVSNGRGAVLYPMGGADDAGAGWWNDTPGSCKSTSSFGQYCAGRVIEEGWQMNY